MTWQQISDLYQIKKQGISRLLFIKEGIICVSLNFPITNLENFSSKILQSTTVLWEMEQFTLAVDIWGLFLKGEQKFHSATQLICMEASPKLYITLI